MSQSLPLSTLFPLSDQESLERLDPLISGVAMDSRAVVPGDLFFALSVSESQQHTKEAIARGAVAVVVPSAISSDKLSYSVPVVVSEAIEEDLFRLLSMIYPLDPGLTVIGITGTNGKSTIAHCLTQALTAAGQATMMIGTLGIGPLAALQSQDKTTPNAVDLQKAIHDQVGQGITHVVMEVSSHALVQRRVMNLPIHYAIFTNLTHDHLDYHGDMEQYFAAKAELFDFPMLRHALIYAQCPYGQRLIRTLRQRGLAVTTYDSYPQAPKPFTSVVMQENIAAVVALLDILNLPLHLEQLQAVPGRMQQFTLPQGAEVVIDYAHAPDALQHLLQHVQCSGVLHTVFGCGGNRDQAKRPLMGALAANYSGRITITTDNPRHEDPEQIVAGVMQGIPAEKRGMVEVIADRRLAIIEALQQAKPGDVVVIAGKGHETYQVIGDEKRPHSDQAVVEGYIRQGSHAS